MRTILIFVVFFVAVGLFLCQPDSYSGQDGETLFNTKCCKCHKKDGTAPLFGPVKYASSQWERFFTRNKHKRKKDISNEVSAEEVATIKKYLIDHAADSDRPIAAGMR
ncbi:MAG: cytochrome c [bacterium]|nr:cytochrome c [bacterium]